MTADDSEPADKYLTIGDFLDKYYPQFAIMGIFGTVSVFLTSNFPEGTSELVARSAIFASLTIFGFTALWLCWRALTELLSELPKGTRPVPTELGYTILVLCTGTLVWAIGTAITTYTAVAQRASSIGVLAVAIVLYIRLFPNDRYRGEKMDPASIAIAAFMVAFVWFASLEYGMQRALFSQSSEPIVVNAMTAFFAATLHLSLCEGLSALTIAEAEYDLQDLWEPVRAVGTQPRQIWDNVVSYWRRDWPFRVSAAICCSNLLLVLLGLQSIADRTGKSSVYTIAGYHWQEFVFYKVFAVTAIIAVLLWIDPKTEDSVADDPEEIRMVWGKKLAVTVTIVAVSIFGLA